MTDKKSVFIVHSSGAYEQMFRSRDWNVTDLIEEADFIQFTGGSDVDPSFYNESKHPTTQSNITRDRNEREIFNYARGAGIPMAGICRGGQFLNVMNGGKMWQNVDNHAIAGTHKAFAIGHVGWVDVTSTHHQMIRPNYEEECIILMTAERTKIREHMVNNIPAVHRKQDGGTWSDDIESIYYPDTLSLCYQPHPEFYGANECRDVYFYFLNNYLLAELNIEQAVTFSKKIWETKVE